MEIKNENEPKLLMFWKKKWPEIIANVSHFVQNLKNKTNLKKFEKLSEFQFNLINDFSYYLKKKQFEIGNY